MRIEKKSVFAGRSGVHWLEAAARAHQPNTLPGRWQRDI